MEPAYRAHLHAILDRKTNQPGRPTRPDVARSEAIASTPHEAAEACLRKLKGIARLAERRVQIAITKVDVGARQSLDAQYVTKNLLDEG